MESWINIIIQGVLLGGLYALYGTGLSLIFGIMRIVNLAHGDFIVMGAYLSLTAVFITGVSPLISIFVIIPLMFGLGYLLQRFVLNRTISSGSLPPLVITFGLSVIIQNVLQLWYTPDSQGLDVGALELASWQISEGISVGIMPLITFGVAVVLLLSLQIFFNHTHLGRAFRATSDDPKAAELMGIDSRQIYALAMGIALASVALAGIMLGIRTNFTPTDGPARLIFAFEAVIIGGLGNIWGTLVGGIILGLGQNIGARFNPTWFQLAGHAVTIAVLLIRPTGLFAKTHNQ